VNALTAETEVTGTRIIIIKRAERHKNTVAVHAGVTGARTMVIAVDREVDAVAIGT